MVDGDPIIVRLIDGGAAPGPGCPGPAAGVVSQLPAAAWPAPASTPRYGARRTPPTWSRKRS